MGDSQKKILIPGGKTSDWALVEAAHKLGFYVITSGRDYAAPAHKFADKYICADYSNKEEMLDVARTESVDYMCSSANDIALVTTTYVCEKLRLPGHDPYETTVNLHHKDKFKKMAKALGLHVPEGEWFDDENKAVDYALSLSYPVIIKPIDLVGGNGITRAMTEEEKINGVRTAFRSSLNKRIVIERFVVGSAHSFATFIINQKVAVSFSDNEYSFAGPYRISTSAGPATGIEKVRSILIEDMEKVASYLHLVDGRLHLQYLVDADGNPYILEMSRRTSGDLYSIPASKALGLDTPLWIVRAECGLGFKDFPKNVKQQGFYGRHCIVTPRNGRIKDVHISPELERHVYDRWIWWNPGYEIKNWKIDSCGLLFYSFDSEEQMLGIVEHITDLITFDYYE